MILADGLRSKAFSGAAIVHLLLNRLEDLPNRTFSLVELDFSAHDLISAFTELHNGTKPRIVAYSEEEYQRDLQHGMMAAMGAARTKGLSVGATWPGEKVQTFLGWESKSLKEWVKMYT